MRPFHLAMPVHDLSAAKNFYLSNFDAVIGREAERWVDINFYGHQLSLHLSDAIESVVPTNAVDSKKVPVRHFGIVLAWEDWHKLAEKLKHDACEFVIEPYIRFEGQIGEQATMFLLDPSGNALEFKSFKDDTQLFAA